MNRRRLLVALAILTPLAIFGAAKWAMRWRPVRVAEIAGAGMVLDASDRYLIAQSGQETRTLLDLQTSAVRRLGNEGIAATGAWTWKLVPGAKNQIQLQLRRDSGPTVTYVVPTNFGRGIQELSPDCVRITPDKNRLELLLVERYFRWNLSSRRLERDASIITPDGFMVATLVRDGETVVNANFGQIEFASTQGKRSAKIVPLKGVQSFEYMRVSPFGSYALYDAPGKLGPSKFNVVDARTGRATWQFEVDDLSDRAAFSSDETLLALPLSQRKIWQIRKLSNGQILRTLPFVPGAHSGAFSPDNATLYSVAKGVLYRQRAR